MTDVLVCLKVCLSDETNSHGVSSGLGHVDGSSDGASKLELVSFNGNNLDERHLFNQLLWNLVVQVIVLDIPSSSFNVKSLDVATLVESLLDGIWIISLCHISVHSRLVKGPSLSSTASLDKSSDVRLWNVKARQPHDLWFSTFNPSLVLLVSSLEVFNPVDKVLLGLWSESCPLSWQLTVKERLCNRIKLLTHTNLSDQCSLQVRDRGAHLLDQNIKSFKLLQKHNLSWAWSIVLLPDVKDVINLWNLLLDTVGDSLHEFFSVDSATTGSVRDLHFNGS